MDHAARLLSAGQSVSAVSAVLGYSSPYNFSRAYKKHFGYPPKYTALRVDDMHGESRDDIPSRGDG
jgi:AraC-like DNA-binding protein